MFRIAVLISGNGSNLQAIIEAIGQHQWPIEIVAVISDQSNAYGLERAKQANIFTAVIDKDDYPQRQQYDQQLQLLLENLQIDLVVLAGFMRILSAEFVNCFAGKLINIHPSLLPKFKGLNTHQRVLDANDTKHGISVHYVTETLDGGPIAAQMSLDIMANETAEQLQQRIHTLEHMLYPAIIRWIAQGRLQLSSNGVQFDNEPVTKQGLQLTEEQLQCLLSP